jgi:hypothetical protein
MKQTVPLFQSAQATANAQGIAIAVMGPYQAFEKWQTQSVSVQSTSSSLVPRATHYRGQQAPSRVINGTFSGQFDTDPDFKLTLQSGEQFITVWENCDPGAICTVTVTGERSVG